MGTAARTLQRVGDSEWVERSGGSASSPRASRSRSSACSPCWWRSARAGRQPTGRGVSPSFGAVVRLRGAARDRVRVRRYAIWRFAQAILDRDDEGNDFEGWAKRAGCLAKGVFYAGLSLLAISFLTGPRGESANERERTAQVFEWPLGRWLVGALGVALVGYGLWNGYRSSPASTGSTSRRGRFTARRSVRS